jgi:hypothetical protein
VNRPDKATQKAPQTYQYLWATRDYASEHATEKAILFYLIACINHDGVCYPSRGTMATALNLSEKTVSRWLSVLADKSILTISKPWKNNIYTIHLDAIQARGRQGTSETPDNTENQGTSETLDAVVTGHLDRRHGTSETYHGTFEAVSGDIPDPVRSIKKYIEEEKQRKANDSIFDSSVFSKVRAGMEPQTSNGLPAANTEPRPDKRFSLDRWCPNCNEHSKFGDGDECSSCHETIDRENWAEGWLKAPVSDAAGKRKMEMILGSSSGKGPEQDRLDRHEVYKYASACLRRWISMTSFSDEQMKALQAHAERTVNPVVQVTTSKESCEQ